MIESTANAQLAASQADTKDLARFKREMDGLKGQLSNDANGKEKQLRKACQNFEAVFISKLWKQMRDTVQKEGYLHGKQEETYLAMFDKDFSEKMAEAGGIGLGDMIYDQLSEKLKQSSKSTLGGGVDIKPLAPQPIALGGPRNGIPLQKADQGITLEEWAGGENVNSGTAPNPSVSMSSEDIVSGLAASRQEAPAMTDVEVKARLDELARRLEAQRIKEGLFGTGGLPARQGYEASTGGDPEKIGRKLAEIG